MLIKGREFGGPRPLFCVPLVAREWDELAAQAEVAHRLGPDLVEWRADFYGDLTAETLVDAARRLRLLLDRELIVFTLRIPEEGGHQSMSQAHRAFCLDSVMRSGYVDIVDVELSNGPDFLRTVLSTAHAHDVRVILSFHDFQTTPNNHAILETISAMVHQGGDIAKVACMPQDPADVLRLLQVTLAARKAYPATPLCTISMGAMGCLSRVAGFLYGSDMSFVVGQESSAPGQIPIAEARAFSETLLRYA